LPPGSRIVLVKFPRFEYAVSLDIGGVVKNGLSVSALCVGLYQCVMVAKVLRYFPTGCALRVFCNGAKSGLVEWNV